MDRAKRNRPSWADEPVEADLPSPLKIRSLNNKPPLFPSKERKIETNQGNTGNYPSQESNDQKDNGGNESKAYTQSPLSFQARLAKDAAQTETNPVRLSQRKKQIDFGKATKGYQRYIEQVPRLARETGNPHHPSTPRITQSCSKRSFDGQVKKWRKALHFWDPDEPEEQIEITMDNLEDLSSLLQEEELAMDASGAPCTTVDK